MNLLKKSGKQLIEQKQRKDIERSMEMTKPEIIKQLKIELSVWESDCKSHHKTKDALKAAIERLEQDTVSRETYESEYLARKQDEYELWKIKQQEPSEDCVSRVKAIEICKSHGHDNSAYYISELPSVTPTHVETVTEFADRCRECGKQKKGKWIYHEKSISTGFKDLRECSCCKCYFDWLMPRNSYCPNCGAEMEDKE